MTTLANWHWQRTTQQSTYDKQQRGMAWPIEMFSKRVLASYVHWIMLQSSTSKTCDCVNLRGEKFGLWCGSEVQRIWFDAPGLMDSWWINYHCVAVIGWLLVISQTVFNNIIMHFLLVTFRKHTFIMWLRELQNWWEPNLRF